MYVHVHVLVLVCRRLTFHGLGCSEPQRRLEGLGGGGYLQAGRIHGDIEGYVCETRQELLQSHHHLLVSQETVGLVVLATIGGTDIVCDTLYAK